MKENKLLIPPEYKNKIIRTHTKEYFREHHYYDEKEGRAWFNKSEYGNRKVAVGSRLVLKSITKRCMGTEIKILNATGANTYVRYNRAESHEFGMKLCPWMIEHIFTPEEEPDYYV